MKKILFLLMAVFFISLTSCTSNQRAKHWGGTETIILEPNTKLVHATWKEANLWYLTTEMDSTDTPKQHKFVEKSSLGVLEGTIIFVESKTE